MSEVLRPPRCVWGPGIRPWLVVWLRIQLLTPPLHTLPPPRPPTERHDGQFVEFHSNLYGAIGGSFFFLVLVEFMFSFCWGNSLQRHFGGRRSPSRKQSDDLSSGKRAEKLYFCFLLRYKQLQCLHCDASVSLNVAWKSIKHGLVLWSFVFF